ncbi:MAG: FtsX-like permease family protein [Bacteroidales bacterium]|nr:FtsX-like permease family protein [Bacteroidales bacterium]
MFLLFQLKLSFRHILRNKVFSIINIVGLSIGLSTCLLLFLYINNELSYDSDIPDSDRIFRINTTINKISTRATGLLCLHEAGKNDIPEVEVTTCFDFIDEIRVNINNVPQNESNILLADTNFLDFFGIDILEGDPNSLLKPNLVLLSENIAKKHFGNKSPVGENMIIDGVSYTISGILENPKPNMHFTYNVVVSLQGERGMRTYQGLKSRKVMGFYIYYKLFDKEKSVEVENKFPVLVEKYIGDAPGPPIEAFVSSLQSLRSIHLDSHHQFELKANSYRKHISIFSFIGILILLMACVNFINMYTASSSTRIKEIGLKKTVGANRYQLIKQFLLESFLLNLFAFIFAIILVEIIRPFFNNLIHDEIIINYASAKVILFSLLLLFGSTFLSGGYIAVYLARISPISSLANWSKQKRKRLKLRDILVVFQFASAIALIASTLMINKQVSFLQNHDVGFEKENILVLQMRNSIDKCEVIKSRILELKDVDKAGYSYHHFARALQPTAFSFKGKDFSISAIFAEYDYIETLGLEFLYKSFEDESELKDKIIINESLLNEIKTEFPDCSYEELVEITQDLKGVVKDFNFYSLHEKVGRFAIIICPNTRSRYLHIKYKTKNLSSFIKEMRNVWTEIYPDYPFEYFFLDEAMDKKYNSDRTFGKVVSSFSIIAILISCIGLLGLSLFHAQQRTKEIGIRKTLGASTTSIIILLNKSYLKWILISVIISCPFVYYYMNKWLLGFAYRINFNWWVMLFSGVAAIVIAFLTISIQTLKSSKAKPIDSLRYE